MQREIRQSGKIRGVVLLSGLVLALGIVGGGCGSSNSESIGQSGSLAGHTIHVLTYSGSYLEALERDVIKPFEEQTGAKVAVDDSCCEKLQAAMAAHQYVGDVTVGNDYGPNLLYADQGWVVPDRQLLQLEKDSGVPKSYWNPAVLATQIYAWVIASSDPGAPMPQSWSEFWDVQRFPGARGLFGYPSGTLEVALLADGVPPVSLYPLDVDRAFQKLTELRNMTKVLFFQSGAQQINLLATQEVKYSLAFINRVVLAQNQGIDLGVTFNQGLSVATSASLLRGVKDKAGGLAFLRFMMQPAVQARFGALTGLAPVNPKAQPLLPPSRRSLMATSPKNLTKEIPFDDQYWRKNLLPLNKRFIAWLAQP